MVENSDNWVHYRLHLLDAPFVQQKLEEQKQSLGGSWKWKHTFILFKCL
jgi:hypothetical protein